MILRQTRDLGDKISATVQYIRTHLKDLVSLYLVFVVPISLVAVLLGSNAFSSIFQVVQAKDFLSDPYKLLNPMLGVTILLYFMSAASYATVINLHMRVVDELPERTSYFNEVASRFIPKFLTNLLYVIALMVLLVASVFIALIPILGGIALFVGWFYAFFTLSLMVPVNTMENLPFPQAIARAFRLIRGEFWASVGYLLILGLIYYLFSMIVSTIVSAVFGITSINFIKPDPGQFSNRYFMVTGFAGVISQVFNLILLVGVGMLFFSLREQKEGGGLESRIETLGSGGSNLPEEQY